MKKKFITAQDLLHDSFVLAKQVYDSGFKPDFIIGVWRGGAPIAIAIQEYFEYLGVKTDHIAIRATSYTGIDQRDKEVRVDGLEYLLENMNEKNRVLIVDDVFDSGRSIEAIFKRLQNDLQALSKNGSQQNYSKTIRAACPWYKPKRNQTKLEPNYYLHQSEDWLVFPHEIVGLSSAELKQGKGELFEILSSSANVD